MRCAFHTSLLGIFALMHVAARTLSCDVRWIDSQGHVQAERAEDLHQAAAVPYAVFRLRSRSNLQDK